MRHNLLILDVDGVLTPETTSEAQTEAMLKAVRSYCREPGLSDKGVARHGRTDEQVLLDLLSKAGRRVKELPAAVTESYAAAYRPSEALRPSAKVALEDLTARGLEVTVASGNLGGILERKLMALGVSEFITHPWGHGGMARERHEILLRLLATRAASHPVYVCDTWQDVVAGHRAGLECVIMPSVVDRPTQAWVADAAVENWRELHAWLVRE